MAEPIVVKAESQDVVTDRGSARWSDLWKKEDYWAIWLGIVVLVAGLLIFLPARPKGMEETIAKSNAVMQAEAERAPFKTVEWYQAQDAKKKFKASSGPAGKFLKKWLAHPGGWSSNILDSFTMSKEQADALNALNMPRYEAAKSGAAAALATAFTAQETAAAASFQDEALNTGRSGGSFQHTPAWCAFHPPFPVQPSMQRKAPECPSIPRI